MPNGVFTPVAPDKMNNIMLGEGVTYKNFQTDPEIIGATRGGSQLDIERVIRDLPVDGLMGSTKGVKRYDTCIPKLTINYLSITTDILSMGIPMDITEKTDADGTYDEIAFSFEISPLDVLDDIAFKGQKFTGEDCVIILENAYNMDSYSLNFNSKDEVVASMIYTGFYADDDPITPPVMIFDYNESIGS